MREIVNYVNLFTALTIDQKGWELWGNTDSDSFQTMLASEQVLRRDGDRPEEDAAWADL
ncbi:MAG: hypothetical protein ACLQVJ_26610 [Syntrophobacteraceae bacterium]